MFKISRLLLVVVFIAFALFISFPDSAHAANCDGLPVTGGVIPAGTYTLNANCVTNSMLEITTGTVTINGNGFAIDANNAFNHIINVRDAGTLNLTNTTIRNSISAGIINTGTLTVTNSTFSGNHFGIWANRGTATLLNSTLTGTTNSGIRIDGGIAIITNSTIVENGIAGVYNTGTAIVNLTNSIISANPSNCTGFSLVDSGGNLINTADGGACDGITPHIDADPMLGAFNGSYYPPLAGSPAIDGAPTCAGLTDDQIGTTRPQDSACDIGAIEFVLGSITIYKNVVGDAFSDMVFDFTFNEGTPFSLSENSVAPFVANDLEAGTYSIVETVPESWNLTSIDCGANQNNTTVVNGVNIVLDMGENVVCTFSNTFIPPTTTPTPTPTNTNTPTMTPTITLTPTTSPTNCNGLPMTGGVIPEGTYTLLDNCVTTAQLEIATGTTVTIEGNGFALDGNNDHRVLRVSPDATLFLNNIIVRNGNAGFVQSSGGIANHGTVTITNSIISNNTAGDGGGFSNGGSSAGGTLTLVNSVVTGNRARGQGGGIRNADVLVIIGSVISNNTADRGGGMLTATGRVTITNSTFSGNTATEAGGGIWNWNGLMLITNSTIVNNEAPEGGGIIIGNGGTPNPNQLPLTNSIVSDNIGGNCLAPILDNGGNIEDTDTCGLTTGANTDPMLGAFNGSYYPLLEGSPAINGAPTCADLTDDQIGTARPQGSACDIGAIEFELGSITIYKNVVGNDYTDIVFDFTFNGSTPFSLSDDTVEPFVANDLFAGTYRIVETVPESWNLTSIDCGANQNNITIVDGVDIVLETGEDVVCTFNNTTSLPTYTPTSTPSNTSTPTVTFTPSITNTPTNTPPPSITPTNTATITPMGTISPTNCNGLPVTDGVLPAGTYTLLDNCVITDTLMIATGTTVTIEGNGFAIDAYNAFLEVLYVESGATLDIGNVTIRNGTYGITNGGTVTITDSTITGNNSIGIFNNGGTATVTDSVISGNNPYGIYNNGGTATITITNSSVSNNGTRGIFNQFGSMTVVNSTITGNSNIGIFNNGTATITNSTIAGNSYRGIYNNGGTATIINSIIANSSENCFGTTSLTDGGGNLVHTANGGSCEGITPAVDADPMLGAFNSVYYPLLAGSPAIDSAPTCAGLTDDQIGTARSQGSACDIGAIEVELGSITIYKQVNDEIYDRAFDFTFEDGNVTTPFAISDTGIGGSDGVRVFNNLPVGVYTITEVLANLPADWELFSIVCSTEANFPPNPVNVVVADSSGDGIVDVPLAANQDIYCHFLNIYTPTDTPTATTTLTNTSPSPTDTPTATTTLTNTATPLPTITSTPSNTAIPTVTLTPSITNTSTITLTPTITNTPTVTLTPSITATISPTNCSGLPMTGGTIPAGSYTLTDNCVITDTLTIDAGTVTINGNGFAIDGYNAVVNVISVTSDATLYISNMTVRNGTYGIYNVGGMVTITNSLISGNSSYGIFNNSGGARLTITNSTISDNSFIGIYNGLGRLTITNSLISGNHSYGIISQIGGNVIITNSTITGNHTGIENFELATIAITNSTIMGNVIGIYKSGGTITITNSIISPNPSGNCLGDTSFTDGGGNLVHTANGGACTGITPVVDADPILGAFNGSYYPLLAGSPAIDSAPTCAGLTDDQIGTSRPQGSACDIGAIEFVLGSSTATPTMTPTATSTPTSTATNTPTMTLTPSITLTSSPTLTPMPTSTPTLPNQPTGLNNAGNMTSLPLSVTYEWNHDNKATWYRLYAINASGYVLDAWYQVGVDITCTNICTINPVNALPANGNYQWWVVGWNTYGTGTWSVDASFTVNVPAPAQPTGLTTVGSLTQPPIAPSLQWAHDSNTQWYNIIVRRGTASVSNQWLDASTCTSTCTIIPTGIAYQNGDYTWTVQGWSAYGAYGAVSTPATMTIAVASSLPTNLTVNINTLPAPVSTQLEWTHDGVSEWFQVWVGKSDQTHIVINSQWYSASDVNCASTCSLDVSGYLNGDYQWWISGWNAVTGTGDWVSESFTINSPTPTINNPAVNGVLNSIPVAPILTWDYDDTSEWFEVWVGRDGSTVISQWYSASDVDCVSTCSINTFPAGSAFPNGNYEWWIRGWSSVSGYGAWIMTPFNVAVP